MTTSSYATLRRRILAAHDAERIPEDAVRGLLADAANALRAAHEAHRRAEDHVCDAGPTLRDQFAMAALPSVMAVQQALAQAGAGVADNVSDIAAATAYHVADAMIAERSKT